MALAGQTVHPKMIGGRTLPVPLHREFRACAKAGFARWTLPAGVACPCRRG